MALANEQPWWELPAKLPAEPEFEAEREHLRAEMARAWRARLDDRQRRNARAGVSPQGPQLAA